jgi:hypothetical protein
MSEKQPSAREVLARAESLVGSRVELGPIMVPQRDEWPTILRALKVLALAEQISTEGLTKQADAALSATAWMGNRQPLDDASDTLRTLARLAQGEPE